MIKFLTKLADLLDSRGQYKVSSEIDGLIQKLAQQNASADLDPSLFDRSEQANQTQKDREQAAKWMAEKNYKDLQEKQNSPEGSAIRSLAPKKPQTYTLPTERYVHLPTERYTHNDNIKNYSVSGPEVAKLQELAGVPKQILSDDRTTGYDGKLGPKTAPYLIDLMRNVISLTPEETDYFRDYNNWTIDNVKSLLASIHDAANKTQTQYVSSKLPATTPPSSLYRSKTFQLTPDVVEKLQKLDASRGHGWGQNLINVYEKHPDQTQADFEDTLNEYANS